MSVVVQGYYSETGAPQLDLSLIGPNGRPVIMPALIDTGLTCSLLLFEDFTRSANWPVTNRTATVSLADGSPKVGYWTQGYISLFGKTREAEALVIDRPKHLQGKGEGGFIGMGILRGTQIYLDTNTVRLRKLVG